MLLQKLVIDSFKDTVVAEYGLKKNVCGVEFLVERQTFIEIFCEHQAHVLSHFLRPSSFSFGLFAGWLVESCLISVLGG